MKKIRLSIACLLTLMLPVSCGDWFDVLPKTDVKAEPFFETSNGFASALAGIYISMTEGTTYGRHLSYGLPDQLAQMYDKLPNGALVEDIYVYDSYEKNFDSKSRFTNIWSGVYNHIANVNNLLKWLDLKGEEVLGQGNGLDMYYGECYGLRGFFHFSLLRAFGPMAYSPEKDLPCMPYRLQIDNSKQPLLPPSRIIELILADLDRAAEYLSYEKKTSLEDNSRRNRLNYHAVRATQARVHLYAGNLDAAFACAQEVIASCGLKLQTENVGDPVLYAETLFGINVHNMENSITDYFQEAPTTEHLYIVPSKYQALMEATGTSSDSDFRVQGNTVKANTSGTRMISMKYIKNDDAIIPLIRLPEMYYIQCEAAPLESSAQYIDQVRSKRGYTTSQSYRIFRDPQDRITALDKEYRKEFYAEGQYWWFLKRLGITRLVYSDVELSESRFVFPLPDNEKEYGWTEGGDNSSPTE